MAKPELFERVVPIDGSEVRMVSPLDIRDTNIADMGRIVIVHPGWGKLPEQLEELLHKMADADLVPLGLDTRHSWPTKQEGMHRSRLTRSGQLAIRREAENGRLYGLPADNYLAQRRVLAVEQAMEELKLGETSYVGHSKAVLILAQVALRRTGLVDNFVAVNGAGVGDMWHAYRRLTRSNIAEFRDMISGRADTGPLVHSGVLSLAYAARHLPHMIQEKRIIQGCNAWPELGQLDEQGANVAVLVAEDDHLVGLRQAQLEAILYPNITFRLMPGRHTNIYLPQVQDEIIELIVA